MDVNCVETDSTNIPAKEKYSLLCDKELDIPIFSQPWWLDATAGADNWDVALVERGGRIDGALPYVIKRRLGMRLLTQPALTPRLGPWLRHFKGKQSGRHAYEKDMLSALIEALPSYSIYRQGWNYDQVNWLPFYWSGYRQTVRYSYLLTELHAENVTWDALQQNIRGDIRKAERNSIHVEEAASIDELIRLNRLTFQRQGRGLPYEESFVKRVAAECLQRGQGRVFLARDPEGRAHAACFLVWDQRRAYYLIGGGDPELRNSGATSLCVWRAIRFASTVAEEFDFEGSMIEPIERFFRAFGGQQRMYFQVTRYRSLSAKLYGCLQILRGTGR